MITIITVLVLIINSHQADNPMVNYYNALLPVVESVQEPERTKLVNELFPIQRD